MDPKQISACRICGNTHLVKVLDLGNQVSTGTFPATREQAVTSGPLHLLKCHPRDGRDVCGLLQLGHSFDLGEMYGDNYGYRSGLNPSMVNHLQNKVAKILASVPLRKGDLILDIGSNDSTTLRAYPAEHFRLFGIDPTAAKFREFYPPHIGFIPDFFSFENFSRSFPGEKAKVITSFSMFYDLEDPLQFMREVYLALDEEGVWVFEQSYMPTMLERNSYDTVCHEHIEYYALRQIKWMADRVGLRIVDVEFNEINGGSFSVTAAKAESSYPSAPNLDDLIKREKNLGLDEIEPYLAFSDRVSEARTNLLRFLATAKSENKQVAALGASTKGNVVLQYCGVTDTDISYVGEVNSEKFGCFTPGTLIPIISEDELLAKNPFYLLVLPWHFRKFFESNPKFAGRSLVFPLPELTIVSPE